jgi:hypothetical protein
VGETPVDDDTNKRRRQYFEDYADRVDRHREGAAFYEQHAIELANNAFRQLTYLNGGGLLAIPTAMALFHVEAKQVTTQLLCAALAFRRRTGVRSSVARFCLLRDGPPL